MEGEHFKVLVYTPSRPYPIRTKNIKRTLTKLLDKGYKKEDLDIVFRVNDGWIHIYFDPEANVWLWRHVAHDPVYASKHNILNAYGSSGVVGETIDEILEFVKKNVEFDA